METFSPEAQYKLMKGLLNERQWRLYVASQARRIGEGGISQVAREAGALDQPRERIRKQGGGRKKRTVTDATLRGDLEEMRDPKGDPESRVRWRASRSAS